MFTKIANCLISCAALFGLGCSQHVGSLPSPSGELVLDVTILKGPATTHDDTRLSVRRSSQATGTGDVVAGLPDTYRVEELHARWNDDRTITLGQNCQQMKVVSNPIDISIKCELED